MDADWITAMRTGAVAAHSVELFAKSGYETIGLMGLGNTGRATLLMLAEVLKGRKAKIKLLRHKGQEIDFVTRFQSYGNLTFYLVDDIEELVIDSDVVISCVTYLESDICEDAWFKEGVTIVPVHTRGFTNCDLFFDKVFADDTKHVCHFKNFSKFRSFAEVSDVLRGKVAGRESDKERIIVYNIGLAAHDVYFASKIFGLLNLSKLDEIDLRQPKARFWV